jgi:dipeptidyl aminopeptidase/acylaminoacyl peptidase
VPVKDGRTRNLTNTPGVHERNAKWSPNGKLIAFVSDVGGEDEIGHHRQFAAAAQGKARNRREPGFAGAGDALEAGEEVFAVHFGKTQRLHFLDVGPGGEGFFAPRQDQATLLRVRLIGGEGGDEVFLHMAVDGVERLRAVKADQSDRAMLLDEKSFVRHSIDPRMSLAATGGAKA